MDSFGLSAMDTQKEGRNFPGYEKKQYVNLGDLQRGDTSGMTETDEETSGKTDGPYTHLQKKTMGQKTRWPNKNQSKGKRYNSEKPTGFGKLKF